MRQYYKKGKTVEKKKSKLGMVSVNLGLDKNKDVTQADIKGKYIVRKKAMGGGMMRRTFKRGGDISKRTSPKKGESDRDKMKRNEKFQKIAEEGREKIRKRRVFRKGGDTHATKEGKTARKGLWYNIHQKRKRGEKMRKKGAKGAPTAEAIKKSQ